MGAYVNPKGSETKESWLAANAQCLSVREARDHNDFENEFLIVLLDNGSFSAAGIAYSKEEKEVFLDPTDSRPKKFYKASKEKLLPISELQRYFLENSQSLKTNLLSSS